MTTKRLLGSLLLFFAAATLLTLYASVAAAELSPCSNGNVSLFSDDAYCRDPSIFAFLFYALLGTTVIIVIRYRRTSRRNASVCKATLERTDDHR